MPILDFSRNALQMDYTMSNTIFKGPIFICAGEASGDLYASLLVKQLKKRNPRLTIFGVGGDRMRKSSVEVIEDCSKLMTWGFSSGIFSSFRNYKIYRKIARKMYQVQPKLFIAVAYPGVNLLLCRYAKKMGYKIYYLLPPQIWAWGKFRKYFINKWVDKAISVFPFEYEFYKREGVKVDYFENPLFKELRKYKRNNFQKRIGFMPGSRQSEIKRNLPIMIELMRKIDQKNSNTEFCVILYGVGHLRPLFTSKKAIRLSSSQALLQKKIIIITEGHYQKMKNCDLLVLSSGTASLEAAIMNIPQIFFNHPSFFDYYIIKRFLKITEYNLTNLYFNNKIVPSFISRDRCDILKSLSQLIDNHNLI